MNAVMESNSIIDCRGAGLLYKDQGREFYACQGLDFQVLKGEFLGVLGPSGSGKSSLLYLLSGLKSASEGVVQVNGVNMASLSDLQRSQMRKEMFGFVFQQPYLLGYLNALENVLVGKQAFTQQALDLLQKLGLESKLERLPHQLSGGERQRVCVARALLGSPEVIFADEPTASLDHTNGVRVVELLNEHRQQRAMVMVTHDPSMLAQADRVIRIEEGKIVEIIASSYKNEAQMA